MIGFEERYVPSRAFCLLMVLPIILSAAFRTTFGDQGYKVAFRLATGTGSFYELIDSINRGVKGSGYYVIQYIGNVLFGNNAEIFFFVIAALQMLALVRLYRKYSFNTWIGIFIFVASTDYLSWMQNGIRQFIAVSIIVFFSDWIFEKKYIRICLVVLVAATVHTSAILMIPIIFIVQGEAFNKKAILAIVATVVLLASLERFIPMLDSILSSTEYSGTITDWRLSNNDGVNVYRVLVYSVPTILSFLCLRFIRKQNDDVINVACNMSLMGSLLYIIGMFTSGIYVGRLPIYCTLYSNGILLPWMLENAFNHNFRRLLVIAMIVFYTIFYYYQTHLIWGIV